jgi:xanthine dehydrogenase accessory factor
MNDRVLIRGGGDLASGVAARLHRAGFKVIITELPQPLVVRRLVSFAEAVYSKEIQVEGITARKAGDITRALEILSAEEIAVLVDPLLDSLEQFSPLVLVDARMTKKPPRGRPEGVPLVIGLGPGFTAGEDCDVVIETMRGHSLGRVIWQGQALANTGVPETVGGRDEERVLRAPADGKLNNHVSITEQVRQGDLLAEVSGKALYAPFDGVIRGLLMDGLIVRTGMKIGDLDPRNDPANCTLISDKSLAIAGGVLEAILSKPEIREQLF